MPDDRIPRHYDVEMIRDFLDHLLAEVRDEAASIEGFLGTAAADSPMVVGETTLRLRDKWNTVGLLYKSRVVSEPRDDDHLNNYAAACLEHNGRRAAALESLGELFSEALACAASPVTTPVISSLEKLARINRSSSGGDPEWVAPASSAFVDPAEN